MTPEQFKEQYSKVKDLVKGHGRDIARETGYSYTTYFNVVRGIVTDPEKIRKTWEAIKKKVDTMIAEASELY